MKVTAVVLLVVVAGVVVDAGVVPKQSGQQHGPASNHRSPKEPLTHNNALPSTRKEGNIGKSGVTSGLHRVNNVGYGNFINKPVTFDSLDDGYPDREQLTEIANLGIGIAVAHRQTKFSPVRYNHGRSSHGGFGNVFNSNAGIIHGFHGNGGFVSGSHGSAGSVYGSHGNGGLISAAHSNSGPIHSVHSNGGLSGSIHGNNGVHSNGGLVNSNTGNTLLGRASFGGNAGGHSQVDSGLNKLGASIGKEFNPFGSSNSEFHRPSNPSLPMTGHVFNTENIHVGVPVASRPVHSRLKGYGDINVGNSTYRLGIRNVDLGANTAHGGLNNNIPYSQNNHLGVAGAVNEEREGRRSSFGSNDVFGSLGQGYAAVDVQGLPLKTGGLRFPAAPQAVPDSFKNDQFFSGTANLEDHGIAGNVYTNGNLGNHGNHVNVVKDDTKGRSGTHGNGHE